MRGGMRGLVVALVALVAWACEPKYNGSVVADVSPAGWSADQPAVLNFPNLDTLAKRNVWVVARAEADHAYKPLRVEVGCMAPDSTELRGSVELRPTKHRGGSFVELRGLWIEDAVPTTKGDYTFAISHSEEEPIEGLWNVGVEFVIGAYGHTECIW